MRAANGPIVVVALIGCVVVDKQVLGLFSELTIAHTPFFFPTFFQSAVHNFVNHFLLFSFFFFVFLPSYCLCEQCCLCEHTLKLLSSHSRSFTYFPFLSSHSFLFFKRFILHYLHRLWAGSQIICIKKALISRQNIQHTEIGPYRSLLDHSPFTLIH